MFVRVLYWLVAALIPCVWLSFLASPLHRSLTGSTPPDLRPRVPAAMGPPPPPPMGEPAAAGGHDGRGYNLTPHQREYRCPAMAAGEGRSGALLGRPVGSAGPLCGFCRAALVGCIDCCCS